MEGLWIALAAIAGLIVGVLAVVFIPFFKQKRAEIAADKIIKDAEIRARRLR